MTILPPQYMYIRWDEETIQKWIGESFTWTDRDSYLAWVAQWKIELHHWIGEIRRLKAIRRDRTRESEARMAANTTRQQLRTVCANLLLLRMLGKRLSAEQRQARLAA